MKTSTKSRAKKRARSKARDAQTRKSNAGRDSVSSGALAREEAELDRALFYLRSYEKAAEEAGGAGGKIRKLANQQVEESAPIRVRFAKALLGVSDHTITEWCRQGILELREDHPKRISLGSVLRTRGVLEEIRAAGRNRDFTSALLNKLELEELNEDERFRTSLAQAKRGERGEWPEGF